MIPKTLVKSALVQKDQRLGNATARTRQPGQHFERTQRLRMLNISMTKDIDEVGNKKRQCGGSYAEQLSCIPLTYITC